MSCCGHRRATLSAGPDIITRMAVPDRSVHQRGRWVFHGSAQVIKSKLKQQIFHISMYRGFETNACTEQILLV